MNLKCCALWLYHKQWSSIRVKCLILGVFSCGVVQLYNAWWDRIVTWKKNVILAPLPLQVPDALLVSKWLATWPYILASNFNQKGRAQRALIHQAIFFHWSSSLLQNKKNVHNRSMWREETKDQLIIMSQKRPVLSDITEKKRKKNAAVFMIVFYLPNFFIVIY